MIRAYKYRFYPTSEQESILRQTEGCARYVWNRALALRSEAWTNGKIRISGNALSAKLPEWKRDPETQWLSEVSSVALQQKLSDLETAYKNFFEKRNKYPRFKKKSSGGSFRLVSTGFRIKKGELYVAKCREPLEVVWSRKLPEGVQPSSVTIRVDPDQRWYVSLLVDDPGVRPLPLTQKQVGLDLGITSLVTTSDGEKLTNHKNLKRDMPRLRHAQRELSRKSPGSKNRFKARVKVARIHSRISSRRTDQLHKLTTRLVHENQVIAIEDLAVRNMMGNHCLAGSIGDASWRTIRSMLEYKCRWYGRELLVVDRWFPSSKTDHKTGAYIPNLKLSDRVIKHVDGTETDRDVNAARNILAAGHVVNACGGDVRPKGLRARRQSSVKQETSRATGRIPRL